MTDAALAMRADEAQVLTVASFEELADEWDDLALRTGAPPFARPGWIRAWWSAFGDGKPCILAARRDGQLSSVLPFARFRGGLRSCSNVHSPVFDGVSFGPEDLRMLLVAALRESRRGLILRHLDTEGQLSAAARLLGGEDRSRLVVLETVASPCVDPTMSWEAFEKGLTKSRRADVRRRRRRLAEEGEITVEIADGTTDLEAHVSEFVRLEGSGWKEEKGTAIHLLPEIQRFYEDVAAWAAKSGLLRLSFMRVSGRPVAVEYTIDDGARRFLLKIGYDPVYSRYAPGVLLELDEIRDALEDGRAFELGPGMNKVKGELMNAQRTMEHVAVFPRSARGAVARRTLETRQAVYQRARGSTLLRRARDTVRSLLIRQRVAEQRPRERSIHAGHPHGRNQASAS